MSATPKAEESLAPPSSPSTGTHLFALLHSPLFSNPAPIGQMRFTGAPTFGSLARRSICKPLQDTQRYPVMFAKLALGRPLALNSQTNSAISSGRRGSRLLRLWRENGRAGAHPYRSWDESISVPCNNATKRCLRSRSSISNSITKSRVKKS